ncbi:HAD-IB family phosphatase, partial [Tsuneonella sp. YG55]
MRIAIYDLDKTLTRRATYTPFLHFAALRVVPWRLAFSPAWIASMIGYKLGLFGRETLKERGMRMMVGPVGVQRLEVVGRDFAAHVVKGSGFYPGAVRLLEEDRAGGARIIVATAAFEFYAREIASHLQIGTVIGTHWDGQHIVGGNCYGEAKKARVLAWMQEQGIDPEDAEIRFVSDSFADAPLLDLASDPIFVTGSSAKAQKARARGWRVMNLS